MRFEVGDTVKSMYFSGVYFVFGVNDKRIGITRDEKDMRSNAPVFDGHGNQVQYYMTARKMLIEKI